MMNDRVIVALDVNFNEARRLVDILGERAVFYKVGLSLFYEAHKKAVLYLKERGKKVFLDLKLADIPYQVERAVRALQPLCPDLLTVHASAGAETIKSARRAAGINTKIIAVTVLTSHQEHGDIGQMVLELAREAVDAGADGIVCSGHEVKQFKKIYPEKIAVVPGIRLGRQVNDDQKRVVTPEDAILNGADYIVVGREITLSEDPAAAFESIVVRLEGLNL